MYAAYKMIVYTAILISTFLLFPRLIPFNIKTNHSSRWSLRSEKNTTYLHNTYLYKTYDLLICKTDINLAS